MKGGRWTRGGPYAVAFIVTVLWSSSYVLIKWGLADISPLFFATVRYALAFFILLGFDLAMGTRGRDNTFGGRKQVILLVVAGLAGYTIAQGFQYVGLSFLPAVTTSFLLNLTPLFVLLIGMVTLNERPSRRQISGLVIALAGAYLFFYERISWQGEWLGVAVVLVSGLGWAVYVIVVRRLQMTKTLSSLRLTTVTMGVGVAGMLILSAATEEIAPLTLNLALVVVWLATVNTALAFFLWNWVLKALPSYELTMVQNLMLIEIALFAFVFLHETITGLMVVGMALVLCGVLSVQLRSRRADRPSH